MLIKFIAGDCGAEDPVRAQRKASTNGVAEAGRTRKIIL